MRFALLWFVTLLAVPVSSLAQGLPSGAPADRPPPADRRGGQKPDPAAAVSVERFPSARLEDQTSYLVELVEFRITNGPLSGLSADDLLQRLDAADEDDGAEVIQSFHLYALAGQESTAKAGVMTAITQGVAYPQGRGGGAPPIRNRTTMSLGKSLTVVVEPAGDRVLLQFQYTNSRIDGEESEDGPPDIVETTIQTPLRIELGKRVLVGGGSGSQASYVAITVSE